MSDPNVTKAVVKHVVDGYRAWTASRTRVGADRSWQAYMDDMAREQLINEKYPPEGEKPLFPPFKVIEVNLDHVPATASTLAEAWTALDGVEFADDVKRCKGRNCGTVVNGEHSKECVTDHEMSAGGIVVPRAVVERMATIDIGHDHHDGIETCFGCGGTNKHMRDVAHHEDCPRMWAIRELNK